MLCAERRRRLCGRAVHSGTLRFEAVIALHVASRGPRLAALIQSSQRERASGSAFLLRPPATTARLPHSPGLTSGDGQGYTQRLVALVSSHGSCFRQDVHLLHDPHCGVLIGWTITGLQCGTRRESLVLLQHVPVISYKQGSQ